VGILGNLELRAKETRRQRMEAMPVEDLWRWEGRAAGAKPTERVEEDSRIHGSRAVSRWDSWR
jgi:hypothetical protein